jgi:hypothetical protein
LITPAPGTLTLVISAQTKKATAAFAGAVVLASGAYAVGSQSGDGSANANQTNANGPMAGGPPGPYGMPGNPPSGTTRRQMRQHFRQERRQMFSSLAKQLGVKEADLRKALTEIRKEQRDDFAAKLAKKLGISEAKVKQALPDRPHGGPGRGFHGPGPGGPPPGGPPPGP